MLRSATRERYGLVLALIGFGLLVVAWAAGGALHVTLVSAGASYDVLQEYPNPAPAANEEFGSALAWLSASNQLVVGARSDQLTGTLPYGAAYLLNPDTGAINHVLRKPVPVSGDYFGFSVAAANDRVAVGAPLDELGGSPSNYGAVYLFNAVTGAPVFTYTNPAPFSNDQFGASLAMAGNTLFVGVPQYNAPSAPDSGRVYLCGLLTGTCPAAVDNPSPGTPRGADQYGLALASTASGFAVGAPFDGSHGTVYLYNFDGITATLTRAISDTLAPSGDEFGRALAAAGSRVLIGAPADDAGANNAGAAYLYDLNGTRVYTFTNPAPHENDRFGSSVAGNATLIAIGASNDDAGGDDAGVVHLYDAVTFAFLLTLQKPAPQAGEQFGFALAAMEEDLAAGALFDNTGAAGAGAAYRLGLVRVFYVFLPVVYR